MFRLKKWVLPARAHDHGQDVALVLGLVNVEAYRDLHFRPFVAEISSSPWTSVWMPLISQPVDDVQWPSVRRRVTAAQP